MSRLRSPDEGTSHPCSAASNDDYESWTLFDLPMLECFDDLVFGGLEISATVSLRASCKYSGYSQLCCFVSPPGRIWSVSRRTRNVACRISRAGLFPVHSFVSRHSFATLLLFVGPSPLILTCFGTPRCCRMVPSFLVLLYSLRRGVYCRYRAAGPSSRTRTQHDVRHIRRHSGRHAVATVPLAFAERLHKWSSPVRLIRMPQVSEGVLEDQRLVGRHEERHVVDRRSDHVIG
ncbi:hypothetical protein C8Q73DRAFT_675710 [Cubamyces lactineus]|nr:hypothetical protein C8Q73DRAFT_675710 [Cubamyces lactineus]